MSKDKFGAYVNRLMTTVLDNEQEEFVRDLAWNELNRINTDIQSFLHKNEKDDEEQSEKTVKQLLQEEKKMSKISNEGLEQIQVIKNALDSMYDKLNNTVYTKVKQTKNEDVNYKPTTLFDSVKNEFEAIAGIVNESGNWEEVK